MSTPSYPSIPQVRDDQDTNPFNGKIMVVAVASLLVITSFVLLLHVYAKWWFFRQSQGRRLSVPDLPTLSQLQRHSVMLMPFDETHLVEGLDSSVIASLPTFIYKWDGCKNGMECVVCLSMLEEDEKGRVLPKCQHAFHVDCIDMWLMSHSTCPICRSVVVGPEELVVKFMVQEPGGHGSPQTLDETAVVHGPEGNSPVEVVVEEVPTESRFESQTSKDTSSSSSSSSSSSTFSGSLRRMLSRSRSECRVFPSVAHVNYDS